MERVYLLLTAMTTLAASLIWGVNTLFLLDAGLSYSEAFLANAFYTLGMVVFEIPTGVVADLRGRRYSFALGTVILLVSTLLYLLMWYLRASMWGWAAASALIGLGFTFYSGATEAWLVDALAANGSTGALERVFGLAQVVAGIAVLVGSTVGGVIAQFTNLGMPYLVRAELLGVTLVAALSLMRDEGFTPLQRRPVEAVRAVLAGAIDGGLRNRPVRWLMLAAPFTAGTGIYVFYALQPLLLDLYGDPGAYGVAGLATALVAVAQVVGGALVGRLGRVFRLRTDALLVTLVLDVALLALVGLANSFWLVLGAVAAWAMSAALALPVRQSYINAAIPSAQRATVLSLDSLMGSAGGVVAQPALGRVADVAGYQFSLLVSAGIQALAVPFVLLARRERAPGDRLAVPTEPH